MAVGEFEELVDVVRRQTLDPEQMAVPERGRRLPGSQDQRFDFVQITRSDPRHVPRTTCPRFNARFARSHARVVYGPRTDWAAAADHLSRTEALCTYYGTVVPHVFVNLTIIMVVYKVKKL